MRFYPYFLTSMIFHFYSLHIQTHYCRAVSLKFHIVLRHIVVLPFLSSAPHQKHIHSFLHISMIFVFFVTCELHLRSSLFLRRYWWRNNVVVIMDHYGAQLNSLSNVYPSQCDNIKVPWNFSASKHADTLKPSISLK